MGKRSKKSSKAFNLQVIASSEGTDEQDVINSNNAEIIENNSTDKIKKKKKKRKHASADLDNISEQVAISEERIQSVDVQLDKSTTSETKKKKKKKKIAPTHEEEMPIVKTGIEYVNSEIKDDESNIPKKKKKKNKGSLAIEDENKIEIDQSDEQIIEEESKKSRKKEIKPNIMNGESVESKTCNQNVSVENKLKVSKSQKKKKTGAPVLNAEESQVTEEDIDRFCDELDEEDNQQYEDWVKLIEASLPPAREKK